MGKSVWIGVVCAMLGGCPGDDGPEPEGTPDGGGEDGGASLDAASTPDAGGPAANDPDAAAGTDAGAMPGADAAAVADGTVPMASGDAGAPTLSADPFAMGATGELAIVVTASNSTALPNGAYSSPHSANATSGSSVTFLPAGIALQMPALQIQMKIPRDQVSGSLTCETSTTILVRYGMPPNGNNQLLAHNCEITYEYDANDDSYSGTFSGNFGEGLLEASEDITAHIEGAFTFVDTP